MAPVARELARATGVLEPLQTEDTLQGQIDELRDQLPAHAALPVVLIGSSWGAVLALFLAARHTGMVAKLILVGSAVFDAASSAKIEDRRLARLTEENRRRYRNIREMLKRAAAGDRNHLMMEWGRLLDESDTYDPITRDLEVMEVQYDVHTSVWADFVALRDRPGYLKNEFRKIDQPTVVIHGEYDPHPLEGIRPFLEDCLGTVRFYILPECGHYPWIERHARTRFFDILRDEIGPTPGTT